MLYAKTWDIRFNPKKTQCITFGGKHPCEFVLLLDNVKLDGLTNLNIWDVFSKATHVKLITVIA